MNLSLRTAARIAWRETRSSMTKFLFVVLAVAAGVGALAGVRGFSESFRSTLTREARTVMAADLAARQFSVPRPEQIAQLDALVPEGVEHTWITETVSMASSKAPDSTPVLAAIKAVDPSKYPYYGEIKLQPAMRLQDALTADSVAAGEDLLIRLHVHAGDRVRVGDRDFLIAAAIVSEPDRMSASMNFGMRLMMSREAFTSTGLETLGSRGSQRYLFKLNPGAQPVDVVRREIRRALPDANIADFRQSHPIITDGLDQATTFLSLISLIALIVGAIGVAMAMHAHLQQKMDHIAVMKSLGATSGEIIRIYTIQTLLLGLTGGVILIGIGAIAAWLAGSARVGRYFAGGLAGSLVALGLVAWLLLRALRGFLRGSPWRIPSLVRQGIANLYRQGNQAQAILVALGLGVMFTLTVYMVQSSLVSQIVETAPPGAPNVFLVGVTQAQVEPLKTLIAKQDGVQGAVEFVPRVAARMMNVNGEALPPRFRYSGSVMWEREKPEFARVTDGAWWNRDGLKPDAPPVVSVQIEMAKRLGVHVGDWIEMQATGRVVQARVVAIHEWEQRRFMPTSSFVFNPPALAGLPVSFDGGVRFVPAKVAQFQRAAFETFPTVTVVNIADALEIVQQVIDQIALVIRFLSGFAIVAGAVILAASVAGTRFRRMREVVILKTIGATRRQVTRIFSVEFLTLGLVAGLMGAILATVFSGLLLKRLLNAHFDFDWKAAALAVLLTAVLANVSGWLASFRILGQKPLEVLREE